MRIHPSHSDKGMAKPHGFNSTERTSEIPVDIACFSEINTDTNKFEVRRTMETISRKQFQHCQLIVSSSKQTTTTAYKPGGTAIMTCGPITSSMKSHTRDRMGRWASIRLSTSPTQHIRIISAYQVCPDIRMGSNSAASQQQSQIMLEEAPITPNLRRTPREAFKQDLQAFISQCQTNGDEILLVGDFNEDMASETSGMQELATACQLADLFSVRLGTSTQPATYQRGTRRIDYVLLTPSLLSHVRAAGYDPFGYRIPSDHRGLYIDLQTSAIFQNALNPLAPLETRDFSSKDPGVISQYVNAKIKYLDDHNFFERLDRLNDSDLPDNILAETLDRDLQRASHHAGRLCSRRKMTPWSPTLAAAWAELHFFRTARTALTLHRDMDTAMITLQEKWPEIPRVIPRDNDTIRAGYNAVLRKLKEARQMAAALREDFLQKKADLYASLNEKGKSKIVQRLMRAEAQHRVYKKIQYLRNQDKGTLGISSLKIPRYIPLRDANTMKQLPDTPEYWETVTVPKEIERLLIERNRAHFGQAEGTPFTQETLRAAIGYKADGFATELILQGRFQYPEGNEATRLLIEHLQQRTTRTLQGQITKEEVLGKLKRWDEATSTSPSGLHLGHYHCMWRDPHIHDNAQARDKVVEGQEKLLHAMVSLLNYAIRFGYTYQRWTKVVNVMLQKDPGNPRIHRLRVIHLYEADFNLLLAVKWRQAIHNAEDKKILNNGLYGSRPGRSAHDPALIELMQHETYRMSMKSGVNFDVDATCHLVL